MIKLLIVAIVTLVLIGYLVEEEVKRTKTIRSNICLELNKAVDCVAVGAVCTAMLTILVPEVKNWTSQIFVICMLLSWIISRALYEDIVYYVERAYK